MSESNSSAESGISQPEPRVVDGRQKDFFIVDNAVVDQRLGLIKENRRADALAVYAILCRKAENTNGKTQVPLVYLRKKTGLSKPTIIDALKELSKISVGLIRINTRRVAGKQLPNEYVLLRVDRVKTLDPEPEVQSQGDLPNRVNSVYPNTENPSLENSSSAQRARARSEEDIAMEAVSHTEHLGAIIQMALGIRMTNKQKEKIMGEYAEILTQDNPTPEELSDVGAHIIARLPSFDHGLSAFGPVEALQDIRTKAARAARKTSEEDRTPLKGKEGAERRREDFEQLFDGKTNKRKRIKREDATDEQHEGRIRLLVERYMHIMDDDATEAAFNDRSEKAKETFEAAARSLRSAAWIDEAYADQIINEAIEQIRATLEAQFGTEKREEADA